MNNRTTATLIVLLLIGIPFVYAAWLYPSLPSVIPIHFNFRGEADGFGPKDSIFIAPGILGAASLFVYFVLANAKSLDPKRYEKVETSVLRNFAVVMTGFLTCLSIVILFASTHPGTPINKILLPLLGFGFLGLGVYMPKFEQNYFAGLRFPWTLENENNWKATHLYAGKLWKMGGLVIIVFTIILPPVAGFVTFITITASLVIASALFSYRMFKNGNQVK